MYITPYQQALQSIEDKKTRRNAVSFKDRAKHISSGCNIKSIYDNSDLSLGYRSYIAFKGDSSPQSLELKAFKEKLGKDIANGKYAANDINTDTLKYDILPVLNDHNFRFFEMLAESTTFDKQKIKSSPEPRYPAWLIKELLSSINTKEKAERFEKYYRQIADYPSNEEHTPYRFYGYAVKEIFEEFLKIEEPEKIEAFLSVLNYKTPEADKHAFTSTCLAGIANFLVKTDHPEASNTIDFLLKNNYFTNDHYRFDHFHFNRILEAIYQDPGLNLKLLPGLVQEKDLYSGKPRFGNDLGSLFEGLDRFNYKYFEQIRNARDLSDITAKIEFSKDVNLYELLKSEVDKNGKVKLEVDMTYLDTGKQDVNHTETFEALVEDENHLKLDRIQLLTRLAERAGKNEVEFKSFKVKINGKEYEATPQPGYKNRYNGDDTGIILKALNENNYKLYEYLIKEKDQYNTDRFISAEPIADILNALDNSQLDVLKRIANTTHPNVSTMKYFQREVAALCKLYRYKDRLPFNKILAGKTLQDLALNEKYQLIRLYKSEDIREIRNILDREHINLALMPCEEESIDSYPSKVLYSIYLFDNNKFNTHLIPKAFYAINNLDNSLKSFDLDKYKNKPLPLAYSREEFKRDAGKIMSSLSKNDQLMLGSVFNFSLEDGVLNGCPLPGNMVPEEINEIARFADDKTKFIDALNKVKTVVDKFTLENEFRIPESVELSKYLTDTGRIFPEIYSTIGKKQHNTHAYSLDIHQLKVVQNIINHSEYEKLPSSEKFIAKLAYLFHDIAKPEGQIDKEHPEKSALVVYKMLRRVDFPERKIERIFNLISNHHWVEKLSDKGFDNYAIRDVVFNFRRPGDYELSKMFAEADLKSVGHGFEAGKLEAIYKCNDYIEQKLSDIHKTGIYLPQSQIPKASQVPFEPVVIEDNDGKTTNVVINLDDFTDYSKIGFENGARQENFSALIHGIDNYSAKTAINDFQYAAKEGMNGIFSTSFITPDNIVPYSGRTTGFILDVDPNNISLAYKSNLSSGCKKTLEHYKDFLFNEDNNQWKQGYSFARNEFSRHIKQELKALYPDLSRKQIDEKYVEIYRKLQHTPSLARIKNQQLRQLVIKAIEEGIKSHGTDNNEVVAYAPKVQAIFSLTSAEKVPFALRQFAEQADLPIIVLKVSSPQV